MSPPLLYYITDRTAFPGDEPARRQHLLAKIREAARAPIDYIQLREKDLPTRDLEALAREALEIMRQTKLKTENQAQRTVLLLNARTDIALAIGTPGVHLPAGDLSPAEVRLIWQRACAGTPARLTISQACHTLEQVRDAARNQADLALFAPCSKRRTAPAPNPLVSTPSITPASAKFPSSRSAESRSITPPPACAPGPPASPPSASSRTTPSLRSSAASASSSAACPERSQRPLRPSSAFSAI